MDNKNPKIDGAHHPRNHVHTILAHSYLFVFFSFLAGFFLDFAYPIKIFNDPSLPSFGAILIVLGTLLAIWAQSSSHKLKRENMTADTFKIGPYKYTRTPTNYGLFFAMLGFGIVMNAFFVVVFSIISLFATKVIFINKEEQVLAEKYGEPYLEYKKSVRF